MLSTTHEVAEKYAQAIFDLAQEENNLAQVKEDVTFVCDVISSNEQLKNFLGNPFEDKKARKDVVVNVFKDNIQPLSLNFLLVLVEKKLENLLPLIVKLFVSLIHEKDGVIEIRVTTARELSEQQYEAVQNRMSEMLKKPVVLDKKIDPSIIGGIIVQVGDRLINGSISRKLTDYGKLVRSVNEEQKGAVDVG